MTDVDILILERYIDDMAIPEKTWPKYNFDELSYARWAAEEILERAIEATDRLPYHITGIETPDVFEVIARFEFDMDRCLDSDIDWQYRKMFSIAIDTAEDMFKYYISERRM